jgi:hypothetical protein
MYEIVPGFILNFITMAIVVHIKPQTDKKIIAEFAHVQHIVDSTK